MCDVIGCTASIGEKSWRTGRTYCVAHIPLHCHTVFKDGTKCMSERLRRLYEDHKHRERVYECDECHNLTRLPL